MFHYYDSPELAVLLNPAHANLHNPRLFSCRGRSVNHDGLKGGTKSLVLIEELSIPDITINQKVIFAILCAKEVYTDKEWNIWADNWLSGKDRSKNAADAAYDAAYDAYDAVYAAVYAAAAAVYDAAYAAAAAAAAAAVYADAGAAADAGRPRRKRKTCAADLKIDLKIDFKKIAKIACSPSNR